MENLLKVRTKKLIFKLVNSSESSELYLYSQ